MTVHADSRFTRLLGDGTRLRMTSVNPSYGDRLPTEEELIRVLDLFETAIRMQSQSQYGDGVIRRGEFEELCNLLATAGAVPLQAEVVREQMDVESGDWIPIPLETRLS